MPHPQLDRFAVKMHPLAERTNRQQIERDCVSADSPTRPLDDAQSSTIDEAVDRILKARGAERPVILAFGAHAIKNGLGPVLARLIERGWVTHLATNGAGIIHDWEFAFAGETSEHVARNVDQGRFGLWQETGFWLNLALNVGAYEGLGYGESVGALIHRQSLTIPAPDLLTRQVRDSIDDDPARSAAAADLLDVVRRFELEPGRLDVAHPYSKYSIQAAAFEQNVPFTAHPMFGHDIIYTHPMNHGALLGRAAERDFLAFAHGVSRIDGGVYLSVGSAVMSPMIFEKSFSMAQNLAHGRGRRIENHFILVVDLARSDWDWSRGEPPEDDPAYYMRYNKTFSRMGGTMRYLAADNRDFLPALAQRLASRTRS